MQLFRVQLCLPLLVLTCWTVFPRVDGSCGSGADCLNGGTCNTDTCDCADTGYRGDACDTDINECTETGDDAHDCDENAACTNTPLGSYTCTCNGGFVGDGKTCTAIVCTKDGNECLNGGTCDIPTGGTGGTCSCQSGYDGPICADDINECTETGDDVHDCDENAACTNTPPGSYTCTCNEGFVGDGKTCTASGAAKISVHILLITVVAVLAQLSLN